MKKLVLSLFIALTATCSLKAQNSTLVVFSEDGFPFRVMLNGMFQNQNPETNVKINNLTAAPYKLKIFFKDTANGTLVDQVYMEPGFEQVYVLKKKAISDASRSAKKFGEEWKSNWNMQTKEEAAAKSAEIDKKRERFVLRKQSATQIAPPATSGTSASQTQPSSTSANNSARVTGGASSTTTTTSTSTQVNSSSTGVNTGASGVSMSVSVNANLPATYQQTTTTTTSSSSGHSNVVYLPGYNGPVGCPVPMNEGEFSNVRNTISSKTFEDSKLTVAKQVIGSNCLLSSQVRDIMTLFTFEDTRLDLAKYSYGYTYDIGNYYKLNDAFQFESSIDELNTYVNSKKR